MVGTPTFGYIVDATGSYAIAWQALAGVLALGTLNIAVFVSEGWPLQSLARRPLSRIAGCAVRPEALRKGWRVRVWSANGVK